MDDAPPAGPSAAPARAPATVHALRAETQHTTKVLSTGPRAGLRFRPRPEGEGGRRVLDVAFAATGLVLSAPVMVVLYLLHRVLEPRPGAFLYRGIRLGRDRAPFVILKIRTLAEGAEQELGAGLYIPESRLGSRFGRFLRATRFDEIPQLWNVLRGDMSVVGPRPERPEIYDRYRDRIPDYNARFDVKPGLTGLSQLVTPHGAPKRLRALLDHRFLRRRRGALWQLRVIALTVPVLLLSTARELLGELRDRRDARSAGANRRVNRRASGRGVRLWPHDATDPESEGWRMLDVNREAMCVAVPAELDEDRIHSLVVQVPNWRTGRTKRAHCRAAVYRRREARGLAEGEHAYVLIYEPISELQRYLFDQYVLKASLRRPAA